MELQNAHHGRRVVIIGSGDNAMRLYVTLRNSGRWENISVLEPEVELLDQLRHAPSIKMIINASDDPHLTQHLRKLNLSPDVDILSSLSAQLLFCTGNEYKIDGDQSGYRQKILESLHEIRRTVQLTKNKEELLKVVLSIALQTLSADSGSIMLVTPCKRCISIEMAQGLEPKTLNLPPQKIGTGISGKVARSGRPLLIMGHFSDDKSGLQNNRTDLYSAICCPILLGNELVGVINTNSKSPDRIFSKEDLRYLQLLASFTADIIKTSLDYERTINSSFELSVLSGVQDILRLELPLQERLNLSMMRIVNNLQGKLCNLYWFDSEKQHFIVQASSAFDISLYQKDQVKLNDFFTGRTLRSGKAFTFNIKMGNSCFKKWFLGQPIKVNGKIAGLLMFFIISDREQFDLERELLGKITNQLQDSLMQKMKLETLRLQSIQFSALSEATIDLAGIHNVRQLARVIAVNACMVLEAESCILNLYNDNMNCFEVFDSFSIKGKEHINMLHKLDNVIALKAISESNALIISDLLLEGYVSEDTPTRSVITMSLRQNNIIMGALSVYDKNSFGFYERSTFSEHDREVFVKYCDQITKALNRFIIVSKFSK